jgi:hypothetical protein
VLTQGVSTPASTGEFDYHVPVCLALRPSFSLLAIAKKHILFVLMGGTTRGTVVTRSQLEQLVCDLLYFGWAVGS